VPLTATHTGSGTVNWQLGTGNPGSLSATSGDTVNYLPPPAGAAATPTSVTVTATVDGVSKSATITLTPAPAGVYLTAGSINGFGNLNGTGSAARFSLFNLSANLAVDSNGNAFTTDANSRTVRRITPQGVVTTYAGRFGPATSTDGPLASATFAVPAALAVDRSDNLYVGDNNLVRRLTPAGVVSTLAALDINGPVQGLAVAANGNVYVASRNAVYLVSPTGGVTSLAGGSAGSFADSSNGFGNLGAIALDPSGNLIATDTSRRVVWQITPNGTVTTLAGSEGNSGDTDGAGTSARFRYPFGVAIDAAGRIFVADPQSQVVRVITRSGSGATVATFAGKISARTINSFIPSNSIDGSAGVAQFSQPYGLAISPNGELLVADGSAIRKVGSSGAVSTLAGVLLNFNAADGSRGNAVFGWNSYYGGALWADGGGTLYLADAQSNTVRKITPAGTVTTIAGALNSAGSADGTAASARFSGPRGIAGDPAGNLYVADSANRTVRKIAADGAVSTLAGSVGIRGTADGSGSAARFTSVDGMVLDAAGNLFVIDNQSPALAIRKITPAGVVTTVARIDSEYAEGLAIDASGNLYLGGYNQGVLYKVAANGSVTTLAGTANQYGTADGSGAAARFTGIGGVTTDPAGNVYAIDTGAGTVRKITPAGVVTTVAGTPGQFGPGSASAALPGVLPSAWAIRYAGPNTLAVMGDSGVFKVILP
jgi:sugar lactone lactonase YvrE